MTTLAACVHGEAPPAPLRLYALDCGDIDLVYEGRQRHGVMPCYLLRHPRGDLIWDLGVPERIADEPDGLRLSKMQAHFTLKHKLTAQLAQLGMKPADVEYLSVSHSHFDHIGNGNLFAGSTWIVDVDELRYAFRDEARASVDFSDYQLLEYAPTRLIEGPDPYDVFGDGSVVIVQMPGHTPGHTALWVRLPKAGPLILSGDMWHFAEERELRAVPPGTPDSAQLLASMDKLESLARETGARVILQHVPEDFTSLPAFPRALE